MFVAGGGLLVLGEVVVGVAEAVPGAGFPAAVAELLLPGEGLPAVGDGLLVVAELGVVPADVVEGVGLAVRVSGGGVEV
ncbi:hypothetical protein Psuf_069800 [Phytohabitans suffuscus]|uniref:Uncharacterized protein n=1 Tax=Phytohabitans suffuscus TaxID=624315 RepID=A0A6F8YU53_9ACTN|nr:hypothetical protein [Phytohabitans suffuscus]BCB89667.1 hypothetical protein Psuf_069800 [Phytohabitans suffuscus]